MRTEICERLGIEFPIFAFTHCRDVAAAVSKAGGLGVLGVAGHSLGHLKMELEWIEKETQARINHHAHKSPGAAELINYYVGQVVGSMNHVKSVRSVVEELVQEYADTMERLDDWAGG